VAGGRADQIGDCWEQPIAIGSTSAAVGSESGESMESVSTACASASSTTASEPEAMTSQSMVKRPHVYLKYAPVGVIFHVFFHLSHSSDPYVSFTCPSSSAADALSCVNCYSTLWVDN